MYAYRLRWRAVAVPEKKEPEEERLALENGARLLQAVITSFGDRYNPTRVFSAAELRRATDNYVIRVSQEDRGYAFYKGTHEDRHILVKKYRHDSDDGETNRKAVQDSLNEIVVASQMIKHRNMLKIVGCCLEAQVPVCIYEFAPNGRLFDHIFEEDKNGSPSRTLPRLSWNSRLRIATEIADAVTYLHTAFREPIIHKHIKAWNVFLDKEWAAKLTDFTLSIAIPSGKTHVQDMMVRGTFGFNAPEYCYTGLVTEKTDVFSFGILLLEILTGRPSIIAGRSDNNGDDHVWLLDYVKSQQGNGRAIEIVVAPSITEEERREHRQQLKAFLEIALRCTRDEQEQRPTMMEAAKELRRIRKSIP